MVEDDSGYVVGIDTVKITVNFEQVIVDAGDDQTVLFDYSTNPVVPTVVNLAGIVSESGLDVKWINPDPSIVVITDDDALETTATFTPFGQFVSSGQFEFGLVAKDGSGTIVASDKVIITVDWQKAVVDAGPDQVITDFPQQNEIGLHGRLIEGSYASTKWIVTYNTQPGDVVEVGDVNDLETWARFPSCLFLAG